MEKAKSRLSALEKTTQLKKSSRKNFQFLSKYYQHLPLLLISLPFYAGVYLVITRVSPSKIEHFLVPNTYLPLQLLLLGGNFFFFSYLFLKTRRGVLMSLLISLILFLKLQQLTNYLQLSLVLGSAFLSLEIILSLLKRN